MFIGAAAAPSLLLLVARSADGAGPPLPRAAGAAPRLALANIHRPGALTPSSCSRSASASRSS